MGPLRAVVRDLATAVMFRAGLTNPRRAAADRVVIVTFHRVLLPEQIAAYPSPEIAVTPDELGWFLDFFRGHFDCGTLAETMDRYGTGKPTSRPLLAITFDDGHGDNHTHARPVLASRGVRASFFVVPDAVSAGESLWPDWLGYALLAALQRAPVQAQLLLHELGVGAASSAGPRDLVNRGIQRAKTIGPAAIATLIERAEHAAGGKAVPAWDRLMDWSQIRALDGDGHEIGSHSCSHPILPLCDDPRLDTETIGSRQRLTAELGKDVVSFCYPNGDFDDRVVSAVERAGYRYAVTTRWGQVGRASSLLRLHRCDIQGATARSSLGRLSPPRLAFRLSPFHTAG